MYQGPWRYRDIGLHKEVYDISVPELSSTGDLINIGDEEIPKILRVGVTIIMHTCCCMLSQILDYMDIVHCYRLGVPFCSYYVYLYGSVFEGWVSVFVPKYKWATLRRQQSISQQHNAVWLSNVIRHTRISVRVSSSTFPNLVRNIEIRQPWCQICRHWRQRRLSLRLPPYPPCDDKSSWQTSGFSASVKSRAISVAKLDIICSLFDRITKKPFDMCRKLDYLVNSSLLIRLSTMCPLMICADTENTETQMSWFWRNFRNWLSREVFILTTSGAVIDENFVKMMAIPF